MPREASAVMSTQSKPAPALAEILQEDGRRDLRRYGLVRALTDDCGKRVEVRVLDWRTLNCEQRKEGVA